MNETLLEELRFALSRVLLAVACAQTFAPGVCTLDGIKTQVSNYRAHDPAFVVIRPPIKQLRRRYL